MVKEEIAQPKDLRNGCDLFSVTSRLDSENTSDMTRQRTALEQAGGLAEYAWTHNDQTQGFLLGHTRTPTTTEALVAMQTPHCYDPRRMRKLHKSISDTLIEGSDMDDMLGLVAGWNLDHPTDEPAERALASMDPTWVSSASSTSQNAMTLGKHPRDRSAVKLHQQSDGFWTAIDQLLEKGRRTGCVTYCIQVKFVLTHAF